MDADNERMYQVADRSAPKLEILIRRGRTKLCKRNGWWYKITWTENGTIFADSNQSYEYFLGLIDIGRKSTVRFAEAMGLEFRDGKIWLK